MRIISKSKVMQSCYRYWRHTAGTIMVLFALTAPLVVGAAGVALDSAMAYLVKERLSHALDAAALAASSSAAQGANFDKRLRSFFDANYPPEKIGATYDLSYTFEGDDVRVSASADYNTRFLRLIGINIVTVQSETVIRREVRGLEVALVLDVTGSMRGTKIASLRTATQDFIDIIFSRVKDTRYLRVGMVPYAIAVNVGDEAPSVVKRPIVSSRPDVVYDPDNPEMWAGCVMAREAPDDKYDTSVIAGGEWEAYWWEHHDTKNNWDADQGGSINLKYPPSGDGQGCNDRRSPNLGCPIENPIIPLTNDKVLLDAAANKITHWCRGGTAGNLGMVWGWRVLSKQEPFTQGADYDSNLWRKAVVMMTDGENTFYQADYSAYGYIADGNLGTTNKGTATGLVNEKFADTCQAMKEQGITVYTVTFGSGIIGRPTEEYYKACATSQNHYYPAATNDELIAAFQSISRELSNLHITN